MKNLFFLCLLLLLISCEDDNDSSSSGCTASDWVGTYSGNADCGGNSVIENLSWSITEIPENRIRITQAGGSPFDTDINGCRVSLTQVDVDGSTATGSVVLNGSTLTIVLNIGSGTEAMICTFTGNR